MTVFVVQEKIGVDITDALRFGEFENLLPRKDQLMISSQPVVHSLKKKLKDFSTGRRPARLITALAR